MEALKLAELNIIQKLGGVLEDGEKPSTEYIAAIGYVLSIRGDKDKQRIGINTHRQNFDEYMWNIDNEDLNAIIKESGLFDVEEGDEKKDTTK
ncbi:hypothetical protein GCM10007304_30200 [Rhodococcoides trifolii]|uniref:Uncharacterized protein n=1 Tax=Rhodococcoides trifolii TaxID=908250 RepID=A0A917LCG4_9NOCA|nr:hypothetical protein [Rhodococcus trifolii]GGG14078.1 hypothetical protein GCM10007304_30200 [Rhodococcus trifolii]